MKGAEYRFYLHASIAWMLVLMISACVQPSPRLLNGIKPAERASSQPVSAVPGQIDARTYWDTSTVQQRLLELGFAPGPIDGIAGPAYTDALIAFQKLHDLPRDGQLSEAVLDALARPVRPVPSIEHTAYHVEADLARQILTVYENGQVVRILPISSGNGEPYRHQSGRTVQARTPTGVFRFVRRVRGLHKSYLGEMHNPVFFTRSGYAIHGSRQVPPYPASHGCIRIPVRHSDWFLKTIPLGAPLLISAEPLPVITASPNTLMAPSKNLATRHESTAVPETTTSTDHGCLRSFAG